jgi:hypothetical protein
MLAASLFASLLAGAEPLAAQEQSRFAACLDAFVAAQQRERPPVLDFTNALSSACAAEEHAYRKAHVARATAQAGVPYLQADGEAFDAVLQLRNSYRTAYLTARQACAQKGRAGAKPPCAGKQRPSPF